MKDKFYIRLINTRKWQHIRQQYLSKHPACERCKAAGHSAIPAVCVHHIIPIESTRIKADMEHLAYSLNNLQALCSECHYTTHLELRMNRKQSTERIAQLRVNRFFERSFHEDERIQAEKEILWMWSVHDFEMWFNQDETMFWALSENTSRHNHRAWRQPN